MKLASLRQRRHFAPRAALLGLALCAGLSPLGAAWSQPGGGNGSLSAASTEPHGKEPLWEAGFGGGAGLFSDYPASDHYQVRGLPFPYLIYRGKIFRSDDQGVRTKAFIRRNVELDLSATGSFPADSSHDSARAGMPDLDYLGEIGPKLRITAARPSPVSRVYVDLPLRVVLSTDLSHFDYRGFVFAPAVSYQNNRIFGKRWGFRISLASQVASSGLQDYFYQVDPKYVRPARPAFDAHGGYLGTSLDLSLVYRVTRHVSALLFTQVNVYNGAKNRDSPLFKSDSGYAVGLGFVWSVFQSKETVVDNQ